MLLFGVMVVVVKVVMGGNGVVFKRKKERDMMVLMKVWGWKIVLEWSNNAFLKRKRNLREKFALFTLIDCALFKDESSVNTIINSCKIIVFLLYTNTRTFNTIKVIHEKCARAKRTTEKWKYGEREFSQNRENQREREQEKMRENFEQLEQKSFLYFILCWRKRKKETLHKIQFGCSVRAVSPYGLVRF